MSATGKTETNWLTPDELAERWRVSPDTIRRRIREKKLTAMPIGSTYRIHRSVIEQHEAEAIERRNVQHVANARRNRQYASSGVDHFRSGQE